MMHLLHFKEIQYIYQVSEPLSFIHNSQRLAHQQVFSSVYSRTTNVYTVNEDRSQLNPAMVTAKHRLPAKIICEDHRQREPNTILLKNTFRPMRVQHLCMLVHDWAILGTRKGRLNKVQNRLVDKNYCRPKTRFFCLQHWQCKSW